MPDRLIDLEPQSAMLYALRGAARAIAGDDASAIADLDLAESMATEQDEIEAIRDLRNELGLLIRYGPDAATQLVPRLVGGEHRCLAKAQAVPTCFRDHATPPSRERHGSRR